MSLTRARVLQYIGVLLVLGLIAVGYWYFQVRASTLNAPQNDSLTSGLIGLWSFNGDDISGTTAYDRSGSGNNGTLTNSPTKVSGKLGQALNFTPDNSHVAVAYNSVLALQSSLAGTFSAWIYNNGDIAAYQNIVEQGSGANVPWQVYLLDNSRNLGFYSNAGTVDSGYPIPTGRWVHTGVTVSGTTVRFYVDGILVATKTGQIGSDNGISGLQIGSFNTVSDFNGLIDEVRVYNRALSAGEIQSLYDGSQSDKVNSSVSQPQGTGRLDSGLAGYWKLDENTGTSAGDSSTNDNAATLYNTENGDWGTGQVGNGLTLDGVDEYAQVANATSLQFANVSSITLSAWVKPAQNTAYGTILIKGRDSDDAEANYALRQSSNGKKLDFYYNESGNTNWHVWTTTDDIFSTGIWYHVTVAYTFGTGSSIKVYINGVERAGGWTMGSGNAAPDVSTQGLFIGKIGIGERFNGTLDEARIYNRALPADEVAQLYRLNTPTGTDTGLKGYWSFNGQDVSGTTAYDRSGVGNNGTLTNGPTVTPGKVGQALSFDGSNDYISVADNAALDIGDTGDLTLSGWFYRDTSTTEDTVIAKRNGQAAGDTGYSAYIIASTDNLAFEVADGTDSYRITSTTTFTTPGWYYFSAVFDQDSAANTEIYINGVADMATDSGVIANIGDIGNALTYRVGAESDNGNPFDGQVDEVRVYNRALSATEIQSLYALGQSDKTNSSASQPQGTGRLDSGLSGYWKLDENTGTSAGDSSTNGNTGTLTNGPTWTTGQIGSAVTLDGTNDYIQAANNQSLDFTTDYTLSAWVYPTLRDSFNPVFVRGTGETDDIEVYTSDSSGTQHLLVLHNRGNGGTMEYSAHNVMSGVSGVGNWSQPAINTWTLLTITYSNSDTLRVYYNGVQVGNTVTGLTPPLDTNRPWRFGWAEHSAFGVNNHYFNGKIDEARIYNRALSTDEISELYRLTTPTGTDTSLKGYWSFNGQDMNGTTAYDRSGAGNNGTLTNGPTKVPGKIGQGLSFDGTDDYTSVSSTFGLGTTNVTIALWTYIPSLPAKGAFIKVGNTTTGYGIGISNGTTTGFETSGSNLTALFEGVRWIPTGVSPGTGWHHFALVIDGSGVPTVYKDGASVGSFSGTGALSPVTITQIGGYTSTVPSNRFFSGKVDEVRVYNRVLTADEIKGLYNASR